MKKSTQAYLEAAAGEVSAVLRAGLKATIKAIFYSSAAMDMTHGGLARRMDAAVDARKKTRPLPKKSPRQ